MRAERLVGDTSQTGSDLAGARYMRAVVAVARSARRGEYVVVHLASGLFFRTDQLGAIAVRALIGGRSDAEAVELVERIEAGAGERARRLMFVLGLKGATAQVPSFQAGRRWRPKRLAAQAMGLVLGALGPMLRLTPIPVLVWMFRILLSSPIGRVGSPKPAAPEPLQANGSASRAITGVRPNRSFNYLFMYLSVSLSPVRLGHLVDGLFDRAAADDLAVHLDGAEPMVGVFLHGPLFPAVPNVLRTRGKRVVRAVVPLTHGINLSERSGPVSHFFGDPPEMTVAVSDPLAATGALLRSLKAGRSVYVSLDDIMFARDAATGELSKPKPAAEIEMLDHYFPRNDGPARLAVRSGRPIALWTTHCSSSGAVVVTASPLLHPDPSLPVDQRVARLSEGLYVYAEDAIRKHPEAWRYWSYLNLIVTRPVQAPSLSLSRDVDV